MASDWKIINVSVILLFSQNEENGINFFFVLKGQHGDKKDQMESRSNNFLAKNQSANQKYDKEVQHLSTKSEKTATWTNESKWCTSVSISDGWIRFT